MQNTNYKTPVIIVSGFLGAGKTTFIRKMVSSCFQEKNVVILENEFGAINFDGDLLKQQGFEVVSVEAGCICCTGVGDFTAAIKTAIETFMPDLIVIEPTGVAQLSDVLGQFKIPPLLNICSIEQVITIADAKNFEQRLLISEEFYKNQLHNSNVIFLSKTENMSDEKVQEVLGQIADMAPDSLLIEKQWEQLNANEQEVCLQYKKQVTAHNDHNHNACEHEHSHHHHEHKHAFGSLSCSCDCTVQLLETGKADIEAGLYGKILRIKGFVCDTENKCFSVDYVPVELTFTACEGRTNKESCLKIGRAHV